TANVCPVIGTGVKPRWIETCAASATKAAPATTSKASTRSPVRGKTASRRVAASDCTARILTARAGRRGRDGTPGGHVVTVLPSSRSFIRQKRTLLMIKARPVARRRSVRGRRLRGGGRATVNPAFVTRNTEGSQR